MRVTDIVCHVLVQPAYDTTSASSAQDDIVVEVHTDEGVTGIGETDVNPWIARACIEAPGTHNMGLGLREMLIGADPLDVEQLWERLYVGSAMNGRRGAVINAIGALDMALHDLRGKALGKPCHELLGGAVRESVTPYASLQPETSSFEDYRDSMIDWAAGEWLTTRFEHLDLMERGRIGVCQPDIGRVGGLTEAKRVVDLAGERGLRVVPHLWKTGISIAAAAHLAGVTPHCDYIEFLPAELSESGLRKDLTRDEIHMVDGVIPLPTEPGLGVELDRDALAVYAAEAAALAS